MAFKESELVFDWNTVTTTRPALRVPETMDESLRDGIQSPSVTDPPVEQKKKLLSLMDGLGITWADVGLPGAGPRAVADSLALVQHIRDARLSIKACCAARTLVKDIEPVAEIQQKSGVHVVAYTFLGTSPIRQYAEAWDLDRLMKTVEEALGWAQQHNVEVAFVTEDTTRSSPATLEKLFRQAIGLGARRLVLCDTVGHATPHGVAALIRWTRALVADTRTDVGLDWHGHNDRGLGVVNALAAYEAGVDRLHGTALGVGERVGNASMDLLLLNLRLMGAWPHDLGKMVEYTRFAAEIFGVETPYNYPLAGRDAFRTATGVHAAAVIKAEQKGESWLADRVYSSVPAAEFGLEQVIEVGPMSGMSNVRYWLKRRGVAQDETLCQVILDAAKQTNRLLTDDELWALVKKQGGNTAAAAQA
ncbi:MAG: 2-isopropylmalate synthase [Deltaproteobacteria bacterium]|nr:2-isopropylmalate synthase [Deltaproteobacteria bacterium]